MALEEWARNHPTEEEKWSGIEFDKLAHFIHLLWNGLYHAGIVSLASPYKSADGIHGPGPALPKRDEPGRHLPALDGLFHIQETLIGNPDVKMFDLQLRPYLGKKTYAVRPGRQRTHVPKQLGDILPSAWRDKDLEFAKEIASLIRDLSQIEVRALGTHQTARQTVEALEYNVYIHLFPRIMDEIQNLENPARHRKHRQGLATSDLPSLDLVVEEIGRKANTNQAHYARAYKAVQDAARRGNETARIAVENILNEPKNIWIDPVTMWDGFGRWMQLLHSYVEALRNIYRPSAVPDDPEERLKLEARITAKNLEGRTASQSLADQTGVVLPRIPETREHSFPWSELRSAVVKIFDLLPGETPYRKSRYEGYVEKNGWRKR